MVGKYFLSLGLVWSCAELALAQGNAPPAVPAAVAAPPANAQPVAAASSPASGAWRSADTPAVAKAVDRAASAAAPVAAPPAEKTFANSAEAAPARSSPPPAAMPAARQPIARVTTGPGTLPNEQGQIYREYDISPYTLRVTSTNRPEQAIIEWILRDTGYEIWHSEPLGVLSANQRTLRVYHTPEVQAVVADVVDRFVVSQADTHAFGLQVVTLDSPNWRARAQRILRPMPVQTPGTQAWVLSKEDATMLLADLRRRNDYREHSSPQLMVNNGQSTVVHAKRDHSYVKDVKMRPDAWPGFEPETAVIDEGFSLEFSPLLSVDGQTIDAAIKCEIDQVEKLVPVILDVPTPMAPRQRARVEVPQLSHFRFHERFRWPAEQVLLVGMGVTPMPVPADAKSLVPGISLPPLAAGPARADMLVFVESKGKIGQASRAGRVGLAEPKTYQGRY